MAGERKRRRQRPVVSRGGIWDIIQSSMAARIATAAPMTTWTVIAVVPWKPNTQGETRTHSPTMRFSHSSQTANAASAAIASTAMTMPETKAFSETFPASNPNIQGEKNRNAPRTKFATSHNFALVQFSIQFSMTPSIEGFHRRFQPANCCQSSACLMRFNETGDDPCSFYFSVVSQRRERASRSPVPEDAQLEDHEWRASGAAQPARSPKQKASFHD